MAGPCRQSGFVPDRECAIIRGAVNARFEAVVRLRVRGPGGLEADVDAVLDTGFTASLTLPPAVVAALGLSRQSGGNAALADGSIHPFEIYAAEVDWGGTRRTILASTAAAP
jgi:predicted aspartyl protease